MSPVVESIEFAIIYHFPQIRLLLRPEKHIPERFQDSFIFNTPLQTYMQDFDHRICMAAYMALKKTFHVIFKEERIAITQLSQ
jgi:hypothetical protein